jgi:hypothetical protein
MADPWFKDQVVAVLSFNLCCPGYILKLKAADDYFLIKEVLDRPYIVGPIAPRFVWDLLGGGLGETTRIQIRM